MFWIVFIFLVVLFTYFGENRVNKHLMIFGRVCLVVTLSLVVSLGGLVGTDHYAYYDIYTSNSSLLDLTSLEFGLRSGDAIEPGFTLLCILGNQLGLSFPCFLFFVALACNSLFVTVAYRFSYPIISIFLFVISSYFSQEVNLVRQMFAVAVFLFATVYIEKRQIIPFLLLILAGSFIHSSIIILTLLGLFCFVDLERHQMVIKLSLIAIWLISLLLSYGIIGITSFISSFNILFGASYYDRYLTTEEIVGSTMTSNSIYNIFVLFFLAFNKKKYTIYDLIFVLGCVSLNLSISFPNAYRFSLYFATFFPFYLFTIINKNYYSEKILTLTTIINRGAIIFYVLYTYIYTIVIKGYSVLGSEFYPISTLFN